jgi:ribosomal protein L40E
MVKPRSPILDKRIFTNMYICMKCNARMRTQKPEKTKCRKCGYTAFRLKNKQLKVAGGV